MSNPQKTSKFASFIGGAFLGGFLGMLLFALMMMLTQAPMHSHLCDPDPIIYNLAFVGVVALVFGLLMAMVGKGSDKSEDIYFGFGMATIGAVSVCVSLYWMLSFYGQIFLIPVCLVK